jgi:hypothetical protein
MANLSSQKSSMRLYHGIGIAAFQSRRWNISMRDAENKLPQPKQLSETARKALAEAEARRKAAKAGDRPRELGGRGGEDPARYGDWEVRGIAYDF